MPSLILPDDDEQQIADLQNLLRRLRARLATTNVQGTHDEFTVAATPETAFQLTYIPVDGTCAMYVNGLEQTEDTDYTVDYDTGSDTVGLVTFVTGLVTDDEIDFRYLVTDWLVARSLPAEGDAFEVFTNDATSLDIGQPLSTGDIVLLQCGAYSTPSGLGCTWVLLDVLTWSSGTNGGAMWLGYGGTTGHVISVDIHSGMHAFIFHGTAGDASAVVAHTAQVITGGDIRTDPIAPTADGQLVFGYLVVGDSVITGGTPADWTGSPAGWIGTTYGFAISGSFSGGGYNSAVPSGTSAYRSTQVDAGSASYGRWGVVLQ